MNYNRFLNFLLIFSFNFFLNNDLYTIEESDNLFSKLKNFKFKYFDKKGRFNKKIKKICEILNLPCSTSAEIMNSVETYFKRTTQYLYQIPANEFQDNLELWNCFDKLRLFDEKAPCMKNKDFDFVIVVGGFASSVKLKLEYLAHLIHRSNFNFKNIYLLSSQTPYNPERDLKTITELSHDINSLINSNLFPVTAADVAEFVYSNFWYLEEQNILKRFKHTVVTEGLCENSFDNCLLSFILNDEFIQNKIEKNETIKILIVSQQPFCAYQEIFYALKIYRNLGVNVEIECVGPACYRSQNLGLVLDVIYREIQAEKRILELLNY